MSVTKFKFLEQLPNLTSLLTDTVLATNDKVLEAFAKLQGQINGIRKIYNWSVGSAPTVTSGKLILWVGSVTTTGGLVEFYPTVDGTATGTPLFSNLDLCAISLVAERDTDLNTESPWAHIRRYENNRKVIVQVKKSNQGPIVLLGAYYGNLNNDANAVKIRVAINGIAA